MSWRDRPYAREDDHRGGGGSGFGARGMSMTSWLLAINCIIAVLDMILGGARRGSSLSPEKAFNFNIGQAVYGLQIWRWFTYQFVHAGFFHLLFNMIALYFFGPLMERWWGSRRFLAFYLLCGVSGAFLFMVLAYVPDLINVTERTALVGASGSIFGILVGCAVRYPHQRVMLLIPPIPMSMRTMALIFLTIAALSVVFGAANAGGDAAHLGGAALGWFLIKRSNWLNFADGLGSTLVNMKLNRQRRTAQRQQQTEMDGQREVDHVLDKVRMKGLQSLTAREKRILQRATDRQRGA